jgi:hypothetical protein
VVVATDAGLLFFTQAIKVVVGLLQSTSLQFEKNVPLFGMVEVAATRSDIPTPKRVVVAIESRRIFATITGRFAEENIIEELATAFWPRYSSPETVEVVVFVNCILSIPFGTPPNDAADVVAAPELILGVLQALQVISPVFAVQVAGSVP